MSHLYLVDGSSFIFRAYHALPMLTRKDGTPINAVLGFTNMLVKLIKDSQAEYLAVVFDTARKNFRNEIYPDYKAHRPDPPEDLIPQFQLIRDAAKAFNVSIIEKEGFEADDLIATFARQAANDDVQVTIVSSDKDLMQLVNEKTNMFDSIGNRKIGPQEVVKKFGVLPNKVIDVQSLAGDSVDNVPGVPGIGVKTAATLIEEFGDLETLLEKAETIKQPKRRQSLIDFADQARISKQLVTLDQHVPIETAWTDFKSQKPEPQKLLDFLQEQNFNSLIKNIDELCNLNGQASFVQKEPEKTYKLVVDEKDLEYIKNQAHELGYIAFDTETDSLDAMQANLAGFSFSFEKGQAFYIPFDHKKPQGDMLVEENDQDIKQIDKDILLKFLKNICEDEAILKIGHNIKYDALVLSKYDISVFPVDDTMLLSFVQSAGKSNHGLDDLVDRYFDHKMISFKEVAGVGKKQVTFDYIPVDKACDYAAEDADYTYRLYRELLPSLIETKTNKVYYTIERPLIPVLMNMEKEGIKVDPILLKELSETFEKKLWELEADIYEQAGKKFNIASPKQLGEILFDELGLPGGKKGKSGAYQTNVSILETLSAGGHLLPKLILKWRGLAKLKSTYTDALLNQINPKTKRVHTSFIMTGASTGRLASTDPNVQNIPIRTEEGRLIRKAFIAEEGYKLVSLDYSQIELRLLAEIAELDALKEAFKNNLDIHAMTASKVFKVSMEEMTPVIRRQAKAINFGIIYGISAFGLANQLGISRSEAKEFIESYFEQFPGIRRHIEKMKELGRQQGYVTTLFGRKIHIPEIKEANPARRGFGERQAVNAPLQGTAADIIKRAMIRIPNALKMHSLKAKMLLQVHDELLFEIPETEIEQTIPLLKEIMEKANEPYYPFDAPLIVESGIGDNWDEAH